MKKISILAENPREIVAAAVFVCCRKENCALPQKQTAQIVEILEITKIL